MPGSKMKKLSLIVTREQLDSFLGDLISLSGVHVSGPERIDGDSDLYSIVKTESIDLTAFGAAQDSIEVLGTRYTVMLDGWLPSRLESEFLSLLKGYVCAWELRELRSADLDTAPVELRCPWFFPKYRLAGREFFYPLTAGAPQAQEEPAEYTDEPPDVEPFAEPDETLYAYTDEELYAYPDDYLYPDEGADTGNRDEDEAAV